MLTPSSSAILVESLCWMLPLLNRARQWFAAASNQHKQHVREDILAPYHSSSHMRTFIYYVHTHLLQIRHSGTRPSNLHVVTLYNYAHAHAMDTRRSLLPLHLCKAGTIVGPAQALWYTWHSSTYIFWSAHIDTVVSNARKTLGFIYREFYRNVNTSVLTKLNITLVRPLLEYSCAVWDLYLQKDIDKLESVQRLACKICTKDC